MTLQATKNTEQLVRAYADALRTLRGLQDWDGVLELVREMDRFAVELEEMYDAYVETGF